MSKLLGKRLPDFLFGYLSGKPTRLKGTAILLLSLEEEGWPHVAILSRWEVFAKDRGDIRVATYATSATTENLRARRKTTLIVADRGMAYYIMCTAALLRMSEFGDGSNCIFNLSIDRVLRDDLPGTMITSGITYSADSDAEPHEPLYQELTRS